ncbi:LpqB family beta-propeller domain-containing protein [Blastococcus sp. TF02A-30]|uniref:LpqB family beta-propeller domain-containing protein n=1 Tax=Blastococcus sp. TF02A-30 TaxID=2250580 RepID=UPI000DEA2E5B|nr:LpqB family beta-propeller domain-containing protein [Blastococcus sp. TF02A-30]RBY86537.1 hypothetical protein DQ241_13575 [Blastococcus sp. TF02A-30]
MTRRLLALAAALLALAGCSTVPGSSPTVQITQAPVRPAEDVGIEPLGPEPGATPEEIVRNFIDAAASTVRGHPVAAEYLAPEAAREWSDAEGITIISPDYATVATEAGAVQVTANLVGTVDGRGIFSIAAPGVFTREFTLEEVDGEWRITNPADGLVMLEPDFERIYDQLDLYFLDPTQQQLVPDPRYLITGEAQPTTLVEKLLEGPSSALAAGVNNPVGGVQLERTITVDGQNATVELGNLPAEPGPQLSEICAQLVWTLTQVDAQRIRTVTVTVDGEPVEGVPQRMSTDDWSGYAPDAAPLESIGHYLDAGALRTVTSGEPAPGPAGQGAYGLVSAAISADTRTGQLSFLAGVRPEGGGAALLAGPYGGELVPVVTGGTLSAPTVAATRPEVWVLRDGVDVVRVPSNGPPQAVNVPTLAGLGRAQVLQLSPDGVRAALVIDGPQGPRLYVGTVVRSEDGGVAVRDLREVAPTLSQVVDVAWRDSSTLWLLAGDAGEDRIVPYSVGVDGWGLTDVRTSGLPGQPTALGAAPTRPPLVSAGGTLWQWSGGTWVTLVRGQEPVRGSEPFYPL